MLAPLFLAQRARAFPRNIILTFLFTFVEGVYLAPFLYLMQQQAPGVVGQAGILTFGAFGALSLYALLSRRDFSAWGSFFMVGLVVLIVALIINSFVASVAGVPVVLRGRRADLQRPARVRHVAPAALGPVRPG